MKKLLGIFAHPDDESITAGGTIAKYVKAGWQADLVCATKGEAGGWGDASHDEAQSLADMRANELEEAAGILGVRSITFLDYQDGKLADKTPGEIEDALIGIIEELRPDVILTQDVGGMTNHPDHSKLAYAATYAFQVYAENRQKESPEDPNPPKLYYACYPESMVSYLMAQKLFPEEVNGKRMQGVEDKRITTVISIKKFASTKVQAMDAHQTQRPILEKYVRIPKSPFFVQEYFILRMLGTQEVYMGKHDRVSDRL